MIHAEFSKFFRAEYFNDESTKQGGSLALIRGIQQCFIDIQNRCVRATDEPSRLVIETASHLPATLKDFRTQELALERQTRLWELSKLEPIGTRQEEIAKEFCRLQIREEDSSGNLTPWTTSPYSYISRYTEYTSRYTKTSFQVLLIVYLEIYDYERKL